MPTLLLQAGHSSSFPPYQPNGGGAPGEAAWATDLARRIAARLSTRGVEVTLVGHWFGYPAPPEAARDYGLFLALHYDAAIYAENTGCFAGRATLDPCAAAADQFIGIWAQHYAPLGIPFHVERLNPNVTDYYAFRDTSANTPGVLIEHGVGQGLDHAVLFDRIDDVADADTAAILSFLGVDDMTADQREILSILAERQLDSPQALRDLYTYSDQREVDITNLRSEVASLTAALAQPPAPSVVKVLTPANVTIDVEPAA